MTAPTTSPMQCERPSTTVAMQHAAQISAQLPVLTTARLTLRAPTLTDFEAFAQVACSPRGAGMGGPMTRSDAWYDFAAMTANWLLRGHGLWAVTETATGTLLGFVVIGFEPGDEHHELGYMFLETATGQGYATEAATAARDYAQKVLNIPVLDSYIFADNAASIALAKRLGATYLGDVQYPEDDAPSCIYRHPNPGEV